MGYHPEEFIGSEIIITKSNNKSLEQIRGKVIDETKKTFRIRTTEGDKAVMKAKNLFSINGKPVNGDDILQRPEERIKFRR